MIKRPLLQTGLGLAFSCALLMGCGGGGENPPAGPAYQLTLSQTALDFSADRGEALPAPAQVEVTYVGDGVIVGFPPGQSRPDWLDIQAPTSAAGGRFQARLAITTTGLTPGVMSTVVRFVTGKADGSAVVSKDLQVTYTLRDALTLQNDTLAFSSIAGASTAPAPKQLGLVLYNATTAWTAVADQPWVKLDKSQGQGPGQIQVSVDPAAASTGPNAATIRVQTPGGGPTRTANVSFFVKPRRISASTPGIAFASGPGVSRLSKLVRLYDNASSEAGTYTLESSAPWLRAQVSGTNLVTVSADPSGLGNGVHLGTVTVRSQSPSVENAETIRVGLTKFADAPTTGQLAELNNQWDNYGRYISTAADPLRPLLWVSQNDGTLSGINIYTGAREATYSLPTGVTFSALCASQDGRYLFGHSDKGGAIHALDLDSGAWDPPITFAFTYTNPSGMTHLRPEGRNLLFLHQSGQFIDVDRRMAVDTNFTGYSGSYSPTYALLEDQCHLVGASRWELSYDVEAGKVLSSLTHSLPLVAAIEDIACTPDGSRTYTATGGLYAFPAYAFDPTSGYQHLGNRPGKPYPKAVAVGDGGVLYAGQDPSYPSVYAYGPDGTELATYAVTYWGTDWLLPGKRGLTLSADGARLMVVVTSNERGTVLWGFNTVAAP